MKLNDLLKENKVVVFGFDAVKELVRYDNKDSDNTVIISTISPSLLVRHGVNEYYGLELSRDTVYKTGLDIIKADLNVWKYHLIALEIYPLEKKKDFVIASRHKGTIEILKKSSLF